MWVHSSVDLKEDKAIRLGHPSYVWRFGQERRLALMRQYVSLEGKRILDVGCGLGMYVKRFRDFSEAVYGVDVDLERAAEALPFPSGCFDVVLLNEVIEHVEDDRQAVREAYRVAKAGGKVVIFAPNRLYPFETHGIFWRGRYHFGNFPLVNYLPDALRRRLCPHAKAYTGRDIRALFEGLDVKFVVHTQIYPGYDKIVRRRPWLGSLLRRATYALEGTPLRAFGLSHFAVVEKLSAPRSPLE